MPNYYGGIEGGATRSVLAIVDDFGKCVGNVEGRGIQLYAMEPEDCKKTILDLLKSADKWEPFASGLRLKSIGLALSGAKEEIRDEFLLQIKKDLDVFTENVFVTGDHAGALAAAFGNKGGIVVIAGTGSSAYLRNPNGTVHTCGGWGNFLSDQGSAYWIANETMRIIYEVSDGLSLSDFDTSMAKEKMFEHFNMKHFNDLLPQLYPTYSKSHIAAFCLLLAKCAREGDQFCCSMFESAGHWLGRMVLSVAQFADKTLAENKKGLEILAHGSVWLSFDLLKSGFLLGLKAEYPEDPIVKRLTIYRLKTTAGLGAAFVGASNCGIDLNINCNENVDLLFSCESL